MKKKIIRLWGVGLIVALLASLMVAGAPVSAGELSFTDETIPSGANEVLEDCNVTDIAVCSDGETIYAVGGAALVYKSTDAGVTWTAIGTDVGGVTAINADLVSVAPDDNDTFIIANKATPTVYVSTNGGTTFSVLGTPQESGGPAACAAITDIALSAASAGTNYAAVSGSEASGEGNVWYYGLGIGGAWKETNTKDGYNTNSTGGTNSSNQSLAVKFSPNFASDQVLTAVITNSANTTFEMFSLSSKMWNDAAYDGAFPVNIEHAAGDAVAATAASIALAPTYLGSDDVERVAFVGLQCTDTDESGIYRLKNTTDVGLKTAQEIHSIAYDGTTLVAGTTGTTVWRSSDSLDSSPTFAPTAGTKSPGGASDTVVKWAGTNLVAGTSGDESAFSVSTDNGASFNDISLIDTGITDISDIAVAADGSVVYMLSDNGSEVSLWRKASAWQRVLSLTSTTSNYIVRIAPENPDVVYVAELGAKDVYYSKAGGDTKWYTRASRYNVTDLAVESDDVAYIATAGAVSKTTNSGFTWGTSKSTLLIAGDISTITCLSEDNVLVGSAEGYVSYSTDGNSSWNKIPKQVGAGATQVTASGLTTDGDYIYAIANVADAGVKRWEVGQAGSIPWKDLDADTPTGYAGYGISLYGGVLYAVVSDGTNSDVLRTLLPTIGEPSSVHWANLDGGTKVFTNTPSEMRVGSGSTKLWLCDGATLYTYTDTMADTGITLVGPADGFQVKVNPISGTTYDVSFTWERLSKATKYDLWIAYDADFNEKALTVIRGATTSSTVSQIVGPGGTTSTTAGATTKLDYMPGMTYYWKVAAASDGPIHSQWSEVRKFSIEPGSAVVPTIGSPVNGATIKTTLPAFSWAPVAGATTYEFQLAVSTNFAKAMFSTTLADTGIRPAVKLDQGMTYFWRVRAIEPVLGDWSTIANFVVAEAEAPAAPAAPPVVVEQVPAPIIQIPPAPPAQEIVIPPAPPPPAPIAPGYIWAIIIIGAVLVIAVIVLIVRTRRTV
jgi:hypothetical protein